jgi:hypothetical protein
MSEIRVTTLKDTSGGNSSSTSDIYNGRQKAWANWNGNGTVAIRTSFNVNSITDDGTGIFRMNFSTALTDRNYAGYACGGSGDSITGHYQGLVWGGTSSYIWVRTLWNTSMYDLDDSGAAVIR